MRHGFGAACLVLLSADHARGAAFEVGVGCLWRPPDEHEVLGNGTTRRVLASAILDHSRCCGITNTTAGRFTQDLPGLASLFTLLNSGAPDDWDASAELSREWDRARRGRQARCFPDPSHTTASHFNAEECCFRPFLDVDIVVAGVAKAGTNTIMHVLGAHPDIVAVSDREMDAYALVNRITPMEVAVWNYWARHKRASKPGARLLAIKCPILVFDQKKMWRIAQIPHVKVLVMLREPTSWLASAYNYFLEDCHRQGETAKQYQFSSPPSGICCLDGGSPLRPCRRMRADAAPRFWQDVVDKRQPFSRAGFSRAAANFSEALETSMADIFDPRLVSFVDLAALSLPPDEAVEFLQRLGSSLGATRRFEEQALRRVLQETSETLGGHMKIRLNFPRTSLCDGSVVTPAFANDVLAPMRASLWRYLSDRKLAGSFVGVTAALFSGPCPVPAA